MLAGGFILWPVDDVQQMINNAIGVGVAFIGCVLYGHIKMAEGAEKLDLFDRCCPASVVVWLSPHKQRRTRRKSASPGRDEGRAGRRAGRRQPPPKPPAPPRLARCDAPRTAKPRVLTAAPAAATRRRYKQVDGADTELGAMSSTDTADEVSDAPVAEARK